MGTIKSFRWSLAALAVLLACRAGRAAGWWNHAWQYRREVTIPKLAPKQPVTKKIVVVRMPTGGLTTGDCGDIRVATALGKQVPSRVLMVGPGDDVRLAFSVKTRMSKFYVYFGNPKPTHPMALKIDRGLVLETWVYRGGGAGTLEQIRAVLAGSETLIGRDFVGRIFLGHNPFGAQSRLASLFSGYLNVTKGGTYEFACSSQGTSYLVLNGKLLYSKKSFGRPLRRIRRGMKVSLSAGAHKIQLYHVCLGGNPIAMAVWRQPGRRWFSPIPASAFARAVRGTIGPMKRYGRTLTIDFIPVHAGETFMRNRYYQRYLFEVLTVGRAGRKTAWKWDFGDGQTAVGRKVSHVYLRPGEYTVALTAKTFAGTHERTNRIIVDRPWQRVTHSRMELVRDYARIVAGYNFKVMNDRWLHEAILLFERARFADSLLAAGSAFVALSKASSPAARQVAGIYAEALLSAGQSSRAVQALIKGSKMTGDAAVCASLLGQAGRIALEVRGDDKLAMQLFEQIIKRYAVLTTSPSIRLARIGVGDVWRARGDYHKAAAAYEAAKVRYDAGARRSAFAKGDFAHHVEDYTRKRKYEAAESFLARWATTFPKDKLGGYWSLLSVRLLMAQGRYGRAAREAEVLARVNPTSNYGADVLMLASQAYRKLNKPRRAAAALKRIVQEFPESPLAAEAKKQSRKL